jgi:hypothetical protein
MTLRATLFVAAGLIILFSLMFANGMFMHGD